MASQITDEIWANVRFEKKVGESIFYALVDIVCCWNILCNSIWKPSLEAALKFIVVLLFGLGW